MQRIIINCTITVLLVIVAVTGYAQQVTVSVPSHVSTGENFRLSYTVNTQEVEEFRAGNIPEGLEVIAGPYTSRQSSYQFTNGHASSSSSITFTYTLFAAKAGTYNIPAGHAKMNGRTIVSRTARVNVSGQTRNGGTPSMHQDDTPQTRPAGSKITGNDLFIKVQANKKRVHEQEPILLTYKVYTQVELTQLEGKMPDLKGFHTQEVKLPQQKSFHLERINGKAYRCVTWSQYVMYPQLTGKMEIPPITFKGIVVQENRAVDPFEAFFNGGSGYIEVRREIRAPGLTIQVDPLEHKPADFSGGVGRLNLSAQLAKNEVKAGDPITIRVVVGGTGNLKLIKQPEVRWPKNFDRYDPKVTDKTKLTPNGVEGNMVWDFMATPRQQGNYTIPAVTLTYYDTQQNAYKTLKTQAFQVKVDPGDGSNTEANYSDEGSNDIRPIKTEVSTPSQRGGFWWGTPSYWLSLMLPVIAFAILLYAFRRRALERADVVKMRGKHASKMARQRLRKASALMFRGRRDEFYEEVLRALWGYAAYKLNMPVEQLSRENISEQLTKVGVDEKTLHTFQQALDDCEYQRYAPSDLSGQMDKTLTLAMTAITDIENVIKKKRP